MVDGVAVATNNAQRFDQSGEFRDGIVCEALHAVGEDAAHFILGKPGQYRLADRCRMWRLKLPDLAGVDPYGMESFPYRARDHGVALQGGELPGFHSRAV